MYIHLCNCITLVSLPAFISSAPQHERFIAQFSYGLLSYPRTDLNQRDCRFGDSRPDRSWFAPELTSKTVQEMIEAVPQGWLVGFLWL